MLFTHDTELTLAAITALVNTDDPAQDRLCDIESLDAFVAEWGWTGKRTGSQAELRAVRALRPRLRELWQADEERIVEIVNTLLRESRALPQLVKHDSWDYHLHATSSDAPLASRMAVDAAMAMVDVVRVKELHRLRICAYPSCENVVIDLSKNRSRRFCEAGCGNRASVAAYRARKAAQA